MQETVRTSVTVDRTDKTVMSGNQKAAVKINLHTGHEKARALLNFDPCYFCLNLLSQQYAVTDHCSLRQSRRQQQYTAAWITCTKLTSMYTIHWHSHGEGTRSDPNSGRDQWRDLPETVETFFGSGAVGRLKRNRHRFTCA